MTVVEKVVVPAAIASSAVPASSFIRLARVSLIAQLETIVGRGH